VDFVEKIKAYFESIGQALPRIYFQDESLTSVTAEERLSSKKHELSRNDRAKGIVDSEAATIILQDFIENTKLD
jgi:RNase H-fold protein (predicted Holliday junction resolvase)